MHNSERPSGAPAPVPADASGSAARQPALLTVVRGEPTPEQLAALLAVLAARASGSSDEKPPPARSLWSAPVLRAPLHPAPGAWRASALPRSRLPHGLERNVRRSVQGGRPPPV